VRTNIMSKVAAESADTTREYMQLARVTHNISTNDDWEYFVDQHVCTTSIRDDDDADASAVLAHIGFALGQKEIKYIDDRE